MTEILVVSSGKKLDATVDYVFSGSRLKLYVPKETSLITFLVGGIECPRTERPRRDGKPGMEPGMFAKIYKIVKAYN